LIKSRTALLFIGMWTGEDPASGNRDWGEGSEELGRLAELPRRLQTSAATCSFIYNSSPSLIIEKRSSEMCSWGRYTLAASTIKSTGNGVVRESQEWNVVVVAVECSENAVLEDSKFVGAMLRCNGSPGR
jgi:hypothetical protein